MLKIRLKRLGAKKAPTYRIIVINSTTKREGKPIEELGHYNPKTKEMKLNIVGRCQRTSFEKCLIKWRDFQHEI